jgi:hypothetical protein
MLNFNSLINFDSINHSNETSLYTWRTAWIHDYESPWGIIQKFKFANVINDEGFFDLFGNELIKNKKLKVWSNLDRDLILLNRLDNNCLCNILGKDIQFHNLNIINKIIDHLSDVHYKKHIAKTNIIINKYINLNFRYCPICIQHGYHSIFHQISLFTKCPFHLIELKTNCPECNNIIAYEINDKYFIEPFRCKCGYWFISKDTHDNFITEWENEPQLKIKLPELNYWINLTNSQKDIIKNIYFYNKKKVNTNLINRILAILNINNDKEIINHHNQVFKAPFELKSIDRLLSKDVPINNTSLLQDKVYISSCKTYSSIVNGKIKHTDFRQ